MVELLLSLLGVAAVLAVPGRRWMWQDQPAARAAGGRRPPGAGVAARVGSVARLTRLHRRSDLQGAGLADLVDLLAAPLCSGSPTVSAVSALAAVPADQRLETLLEDLRRAALDGQPVSAAWFRFAHEYGSREAAFVGRAWLLSEQTGAPLAEALRCAGQVLRADAVTRQRLASASAGPRASMAVLCLLPLAGPVVGLVFGVSPADLYFGSPLAAGSLVLGLLLAAVGLAWSCALLRRATRPRPATS